MDNLNDNSISLNKYISSTGRCSRREADKMIEAGRVTINGIIAKKGNRVVVGDVVTLDEIPISSKPEPIYIAFHKPVGVVCTTDQKDPKNIIDFIQYPQRIFPIGRLDKASEGLIFLTNDGDIVNKILRAGNKHEKEYIVTVNKTISAYFISKMSAGIPILDTVTQKCKVEYLDKKTFKIILTQGLNRQIRRMCAYLGYEVIRLKRVRIMRVTLDGIKSGQWRYLTPEELTEIHQMIQSSSKTKEASIDPNKKA